MNKMVFEIKKKSGVYESAAHQRGTKEIMLFSPKPKPGASLPQLELPGEKKVDTFFKKGLKKKEKLSKEAIKRKEMELGIKPSYAPLSLRLARIERIATQRKQEKATKEKEKQEKQETAEQKRQERIDELQKTIDSKKKEEAEDYARRFMAGKEDVYKGFIEQAKKEGKEEDLKDFVAATYFNTGSGPTWRDLKDMGFKESEEGELIRLKSIEQKRKDTAKEEIERKRLSEARIKSDEWIKEHPELEEKYRKSGRMREFRKEVQKVYAEGGHPDYIDWEAFGTDIPVQESREKIYKEDIL